VHGAIRGGRSGASAHTANLRSHFQDLVCLGAHSVLCGGVVERREVGWKRRRRRRRRRKGGDPWQLSMLLLLSPLPPPPLVLVRHTDNLPLLL